MLTKPNKIKRLPLNFKDLKSYTSKRTALFVSKFMKFRFNLRTNNFVDNDITIKKQIKQYPHFAQHGFQIHYFF